MGKKREPGRGWEAGDPDLQKWLGLKPPSFKILAPPLGGGRGRTRAPMYYMGYCHREIPQYLTL